MDVLTLLLSAMFQLLNITMAEWNPNSSLYLVDIPTRSRVFIKIFPLEIPSTATRRDRNDAKYYAFCPNPDAGNPNYNYGNLSKGVSESMTGELEKECLSPVVYVMVPQLIPILNNQTLHVQCSGSQKSGHIYHFVYLLSEYDVGVEVPEVEKIIYRVCYRDDEKQMIYASAAIEKPSLLRDDLLHDEQNYQFEFDITHYYDNYTQDIINVSASLYAETSNYTPIFILPPELFSFAHQRITFYHYMNLAPMESTLVGQWKLCLNGLVDKLSTHNYPINVYAGLLGVLRDGYGNFMYLGEYNDKKEVPIPSIFWILIASDTDQRGVVIMIHNRYYSTVGIQPNQLFYNDNDCTAQVCRDANLANILPASQLPIYIVCCKPKAINNHFQLRITNTLFRFR